MDTEMFGIGTVFATVLAAAATAAATMWKAKSDSAAAEAGLESQREAAFQAKVNTHFARMEEDLDEVRQRLVVSETHNRTCEEERADLVKKLAEAEATVIRLQGTVASLTEQVADLRRSLENLSVKSGFPLTGA